MIARPHLRALMAASLCCAPVWASGEGTASPQPPTASAPVSFFAAEATGFCAAPSAPAGWLLAAADTSPANPAAAASPAAHGGASPPLKKLARIQGDITYTSDEETATTAGITQLSGNVDVHMEDKQLQADQVTYDSKTDSLSVVGHVRVQDPALQLQGDTGNYTDEGSQFTHAQFRFLQHPGYGSAEQVWISPTNVVTLRHVTYTNCPPPRTDWQIHARELTLDTTAERGVGRGAVVDFKGVPIAYVPWISFPLSESRQTGFLFPDFGTSSRTGVTLGVPFYWNIAPNQDATFTPTYYSQRGAALGAQYRYLSATNSGTLDGAYLPYDDDYHSGRSYLRLIDRQQFADNIRLDTNLEGVSDTEYFTDFTQGTELTSTPFLERSLTLTHRDDIWDVQGALVGFQTLDDTLPVEERPYIQLPRLTAAANWSPAALPALQTGFDGELADFTRAVGVTGWRMDLRPQIGFDFEGPGYFLRPNVAWEFTQYALRETAGSGLPDDAPSRSLPIVTLDTGLEFEREAGARSITLEPRLMYTYIPYRNQDDLPVFDTATPDLNLIELFRPNRYVGLDRIGDANEVTLGVTSQLFNNQSGARYLSATIGQAVFLQAPRVTLPNQTPDAVATPSQVTVSNQPPNSTATSSLIAELNLTAYHNWNLLLDAASDAAVTRIEQSEIALQYRPSTNQVVNVGYWYRSDALQQIDTSVAWPLTRNWDLYARAVYSLLDHQSIEDFAGFQYQGDCWGIRLLAQRSVISHTLPVQYDSGFMVQVELTGLSNVGSQVSTFLEHSIRGYSPAANPAQRMGSSL